MNQSIIEKHMFSVWSETDREKRKTAINEVYTENCLVYDPMFPDPFQGRSNLLDLIDNVQHQFPGFVFRIESYDAHHQAVRLHWSYGLPGEEPEVKGEDFMLFENNQIQTMYIYIDQPPAK
ncbi:nuclear transport factor 2 family protein [Paenibacillus glycanilyticus]|uniref:nuclear transport factor 2 family protein n=1 Tax=Paenibacillus glycanilyticus TaxID=126569 RepID=UPI0020405F0D|nr:nuclear transport factor 2 family protein [Paenibacillus glycanilyticus]MCM3629089.1 nuclear transport factor 2 family protein [Paenibacillus glycanilyticus]